MQNAMYKVIKRQISIAKRHIHVQNDIIIRFSINVITVHKYSYTHSCSVKLEKLCDFIIHNSSVIKWTK